MINRKKTTAKDTALLKAANLPTISIAEPSKLKSESSERLKINPLLEKMYGRSL